MDADKQEEIYTKYGYKYKLLAYKKRPKLLIME